MVTQSIPLVADLRNQNRNIGTIYLATGLVTEGDTGGGIYFWNPSLTNPDDGFYYLQVTGVAIGRWTRIYAGSNIYNTDGSLLDNRDVSLNGYYLKFIGSSANSTFNADGSVTLGSLSGPNTRIVVAGTTGTLSTQSFVPGTTIRFVEKFTATLGQTVFNTANTLYGDLFDVFLNGVKLNTDSFSFTANQITLLDGSYAGDIIDVVGFSSVTVYATLPSQAGNAGKFLSTDGTSLSWEFVYGLPIGGTTGQVLKKFSNSNYDVYWAIDAGGLTSVGLSMPSAFNVANSPLTSNGTLTVTGAGTAAQYVRGDGALATFPSTASGGSSVNYYLNGSVNASVAGYKQMANTAVIGTGTNFTLTGNGLIAQFLTDVGNPNRLEIPGGAWNFEMYFQSSSNGGNEGFYVELLKYNGTTFTSIASSSTNPESITGGTSTDLYLTSLAVPTTALLVTDRLAIRVYIVNNAGARTITLKTEDNNLCEIITTFAGGISALNGLTANTQYFATGTSGTDFAISSATDTHTFNLPTASATNRGALSSADWTTFSDKVGGSGVTGQVAYWSGTNSQTGSNNLFWDAANARLGIGTNAPASKLEVVNNSVSNYIYTTTTNTTIFSGLLIRTGGVDYMGAIGRLDTGEFRIGGFNATGYFLTLYSNNAERARLFAGGNFALGGTTDGGQRLQVYGDAFIKGSGSTSATSALVVQNSAGENLLQVRNDGFIFIGGSANRPWFLPVNGISSPFVSGTALQLNIDNSNARTTTGFDFLISSGIRDYTSGNVDVFRVRNSFTPTSGTGTMSIESLNPTINQTGGANGITRGLYVNPTLTAAADWRSIEWSNNSGWGLYGAGTANNYLGGRLGIGNTSPARPIDVLVSNDSPQSIGIKNSSNGLSARAGFIAFSDTNEYGGFSVTSSQFSNSTYRNNANLLASKGIILSSDDSLASSGTSRILFITGGYNNNPTLSITAGNPGRVLIGTTTESTFLLDVNGTARVSGYALFGSGNSGTPLATLADFRGGSDVDFIQVARASTSSDRYVRMYANGQIDALSTKTDAPPFTFAAAANANTSGTRGLFTLANTFNPTSGTATYTTFQINQTINQTGGANGITRGLYVNPTLTSAFDFRAIETSAGNVLFGSNFFWDNTNSRLGIGTNAPANRLEVQGGDVRFSNALTIGTAGTTGFGFSSNTITTYTNSFLGIPSDRHFSFTDSSFSSVYLRIVRNTGSVIVGGTTDGGQRLQVYGDAFVKGSGNTSATNALLVQNSAGTEILKIQNNSTVNIKAPTNTEDTNVLVRIDRPNLGKILLITDQAAMEFGNSNYIAPSNGIDGTFSRSVSGLFIGQKEAANTTTGVFGLNLGRPNNINNQVASTTNMGGLVQVIGQFNPNSSIVTPFTSLYLIPTINQTGGANGITRGLYVNPTLTAAADWRSIEWSNNSGWGLYGAGTANNYLGGNLALKSTIPTTLSSIYAYEFIGQSGVITCATNANDVNINNNGYYNGALGIYKNNGISSAISLDSTGNIVFYNAPSGTAGNTLTYSERMRLTLAGRLLLGTTTESTFLLDVNGTARVSGTLTLTPGASDNAIVINNNGYIKYGTTVYVRGLSTTYSISDSAFSNKFLLHWGGSTSYFVTGGNYIFNGTTANASAIVQIDSTTQGFLPPRMTTTQKTNIATPAAGLVVYDTDTNKLCCYNGTTWNDLF